MTHMPDWTHPDDLRARVPDLRQLASVRRITLDEGAERGQQAYAFSTGAGLDFWLLADRAMDIGPLWFRGMPVAWQHPAGFVAPGQADSWSDDGTGIQRALSGFLVTCGLDHIRQPANGLPLHGTLPLTPARVTAHGEDWDAPTPVLYCEGTVTSAHLGGACLRLHRRIEAAIGQTRLSIIDRVENIGPDPAQMHALYHINFGFPAMAEGTTVRVNDELRLTCGAMDARSSQPALSRAVPPGQLTRTVLRREAQGVWPAFQASLTSDPAALPFLQLWSDARPRRNILSLEPVTTGRNADGSNGPGPILQPGGMWASRQEIAFTTPAPL
ncbi:MAG: DUF4432 family protein [Cypionkella sp.]